MKKRLLIVLVLLFLLSSIFVAAQEEIKEECGFWCKVKKLLFRTGGEEKALVRKGGNIV